VVADVEPDVADAVEEQEITGLQRPAGDPAPAVELRVRVVRERDAEVRVDVARKARAVEPARADTAPHVRDAEKPAGVPDDARPLASEWARVTVNDPVAMHPVAVIDGGGGQGCVRADAGGEDEQGQEEACATRQETSFGYGGAQRSGEAPRSAVGRRMSAGAGKP